MSISTDLLEPDVDRYVVSSASTVEYDRSTKQYSRRAVAFLISPTSGSGCPETITTEFKTSKGKLLEMASFLRDKVFTALTADDEMSGWGGSVEAATASHPDGLFTAYGAFTIPAPGKYVPRHRSLSQEDFERLLVDGCQVARVVFSSRESGVLGSEEKAAFHERAKMIREEFLGHADEDTVAKRYLDQWSWYQASQEGAKTMELSVAAVSALILQQLLQEKAADAED
jgi:hypothetical protein